MNNSYYYFSTHTTTPSIYSYLEAYNEYKNLDEESRCMLDLLVKEYHKRDKTLNAIDYCSKFIIKHQEEFHELIKLKGSSLKYFLNHYLGYSQQWGASTQSFVKSSSKKAEEISEQELIQEMTDAKGSIKKLLNSSGKDLSAVKPFLPAIMISLDTNTRDKEKMQFKHTGRFCFDFDKFKDTKDAIKWMKKVWRGTKNVNPYMGFISPRGKGFKIFCKVDTLNDNFQKDFNSEEKKVVIKHHKVWYEGAVKELATKFPELKNNIDESTNDPQRLTYLPYIANKVTNFKYDPFVLSNYSEVVNNEKAYERKELEKKISENKVEVVKIMKANDITSEEDAYHLFLKNKSYDFDLEYETEKFIKVVDFLEEQTSKDSRVESWVCENFNDYNTLQKLSWVLYGIFGDLAIEQMKRLIPQDSNKLNEDHNDYRWAIRSKNDYDQEQRKNLTPAPFYAKVRELECVKDFLSDHFGVSSLYLSDIKIMNDYYETYINNKDLYEDKDDQADLGEFLDNITRYIDKKKIRLPLIEELDTLTSEIKLGPSDYLDKEVMHDLFQNKYADKRIFCLRSQCGSGKNSIFGNYKYKLPGRVALGTPFKSIGDQVAFEAWHDNDPKSKNQMFVNSSIEATINSFKNSDSELTKLNYANTLKGGEISKNKDIVIHTTYNQILNISHDEMTTFDYIVIDESHTLSDGLDYRADTIVALIHYLIEFVAKKRSSNTKIIFMSGTPNVETEVIAEYMEAFQIKSLFQRVIVDKKYKVKPTIHLTHLDTEDATERRDTVIRQINKYLKQGRKVCHIFNNKAKMDRYVREIQDKLSSSIKVGLFYSGSEGECTRNIQSGKFGDYDVVLTTTYFINGININRDGLTQDELRQGKTSTQKYGVVIDLGKNHTKVDAISAIQAINRFRNRLCHSTILLPKIFKPDLQNTTRKFDYGKAGRTLLGITKYNAHLLSVDKDVKPNKVKELEQKNDVYLLEEVRNNPSKVSLKDISERSEENENKKSVINRIHRKVRLYEDWYYSLEGYHYLAKDAGFLSIIKHKYIEPPLKEMTEDQIELENKVIRNFLDDEIALIYLDNHLDIDRRILVKSSCKIKNPMNVSIGNFSAISILNGKYVVEGDFHVSHERTINSLVRYHLNLCYWYGSEKAIEILRFLINPRVAYFPSKSSSYLKNISKYIKACKFYQSSNFLKAIQYMKAVDYLSQHNLGITKKIKSTYITYTITNCKLVQILKDQWAKQQFEMTQYKIDTSQSSEKDNLNEYYSKPELIKDLDLKDLAEQLNKIFEYRPLKYSKIGELKNYETIIIPRIIKSTKLSIINIEDVNAIGPEFSTYKENSDELRKFFGNTLRKLNAYIEQAQGANQSDVIEIYNALKSKLEKKDIESSMKYVEDLTADTTKVHSPEVIHTLRKLKNDISKIEEWILVAFTSAEYSIFKELSNFNAIPTFEKIFFCEEDFKIESLDKKFSPNLKKVSKFDIYDSLKQHSKLFINRIRTRSNNAKVTLGNSSTFKSINTKTSYTILDKKGGIIYSDFSLTKVFKFLCDYAFNNERFEMEDGSTPIKNYNKGVYNPNTFKRDYYSNSSKSKTVSNYIIKIYDVNIKDYVTYVQSIKLKKVS